MKDIEVFLKKKKKKSKYMITNNIKIFQKIKSIGQMSTENYTKKNYDYKKLLLFGKLEFFL